MDKQEPCEQFTPHPIRKRCNTCKMPFEDHPFSEDDADKIKGLIKVLSEYPEAKLHGQYSWTPFQCPINRLDEYFQKFPENKVPRHRSKGQKNRLKRLAFQIPQSDLLLEKCRFLDPRYRGDMENYEERLQSKFVRLGFVKEWTHGMPIQCPKCLLVLQSDELVVTTSENGGQAYHPTCFVCFQCGDFLADLIHCTDIDGTLFCLRHFGDNTAKRCHTCDELIFSSHFSLAGENFYHREHVLCCGCDGRLEGNKGFTKEGNLYCAPCYEAQFCSDCVQCKKKITVESRHIVHKDKSWHDECFTCTSCDAHLSDSPFEIVDEKFLCSECYRRDHAPRCEGCCVIFDQHSTVVRYEGNIFHVPCFKCDDCKETIGTGPFVPHKSSVYCKACHLRNFGVRCYRCRYAITSDRGIMYNKQPYHEECFICFNCSTQITSRPFKTVDDNWYCLNCYGDKFCKKCSYCDKPILLGTDQDVLYSYEDYRWHASCFVCSVCRNSLADVPFMMRENVLVCKPCLPETTLEKENKETNLEKEDEEKTSTEHKEKEPETS